MSALMARDRTVHNDITSDVTSPLRMRRGEVLLGVERRRKWPDDKRIAIVAEALEPGAVISQVARRHDLYPSQLFGWMKQYRSDAMALRSAKAVVASPAFVPAMLDLAASVTPSERPFSSGSTAAVEKPCGSEIGTIEITIGSATVRIQGAADAKTLAVVLKALRSLT